MSSSSLPTTAMPDDMPDDFNYSDWKQLRSFSSNSTHSAMDNFCGSRFWDMNVTWYTEDPGFTRCFQLTVLVWFPCIFLWLLGPIEAFTSARSSARSIPWTWLNLSRLGLAAALCLVSAADTGFESRQLMARIASHSVDYVAPAIRMVTFGLAGMLGVLHRMRGRRSSPVLWIFWLLLTLCGVPQLRDDIRLLNAKGDATFRAGSYVATWCATLLQLLLASFADAPPREPYIPEQENPCPEEGASFPSRLFFSWCTAIVWRGFRRPLELRDLWALRPQDTTREVFPLFRALLQDARRKRRATNGVAAGARAASAPDKPEVTSVLPALLRCFGPLFLVSSVIRVGQMCLKYSAPSLLSLLIQFASSDEPAWRGFFYAGLLLVVITGETIMYGAQHRFTTVVSMRVNTALVAAIYKKALRLSSAARKESTTGEIVNLMSVDTRRFVEVCGYLNLAWASPMEIGIALALLWMQLGLAMLAGLGAVLLLVPMSMLVMRRLEALEGRQMKQKDARIKMMTEILAGIRVLKLYAWEPSFEQRVKHVRSKEQAVLRTRAILDACISLMWVCAPTAVAVVTFATYLLIDKSHVLDAEKAFVSLALVNMIRLPLVMLPHLIVNLVQVKVSLGRINKFINAEELDPSSVSHDYSNPLALSIVDGDFSWAAGEPPTLRGVQMAVREGQLTAVVGPVGAGKSSLLAVLLGEMHRINGRVNSKGTVAYVPQQAWMQNATLQDNILFGRPLDLDRYERVIDACALRPDLEMLPAGDRTEIGEKGINLSGGQKQRVSLARAVYADTDVFLLDDPLSAVDSHVGKHLFQEVIGPTGLLKHKTRVLVTHAVTYLPETDNILVLKNGEVSESGSYTSLLEQGGAFSEFLQQHTQESTEPADTAENDEDNDEKNLEGGDVHRELKRLLSRTSRASRSSTHKLSVGESEDEVLAAAAAAAAEAAARDKAGEHLIEEEHMEKGRVSWRVYWLYLRSMGGPLVLATLAANIVYQGFSVGSGAWLARWSSSGHQEDPSFYIIIYAALGVGYSLGSFLAGLSPQLGGWRAACLLHGRLLHRVLRAPMAFFDTTPAGRIVARFSKDVDALDNSLPGEFDSTVACSFEALSILLIISYSTPIFLAAVGPIMLIYIFIQQVYISTARQMFRLESTTRSPVYSHFGETITGAATIRAFGRQKDFEKESEVRVDTNQRCFFAGLMTETWMEIRVELVGNLVVFLAALFSTLGRGHITPGLVGLSISFSLQVTGMFNWLVQIMSLLEKSIVSVERIDEYCNITQEADWERPCSRDLSMWPEQGEVCVENLQLRYREGLDLVLQGVSFCARPGEKVGIVGRTGAGKSSLTLALFRLVEPAGGRVAIDGVDAAQLGLHALRSRLTIIPQDPVLFSGTLRLNLDPFERHSDAQLWRALDLAHLRAFVDSLPEGLSHEVAEGGENLSVGQRQLVCLARALLRKSKVLVLDEATAAVDLETDVLIQRTIRSEFSECTVLTIAHRINTIMDCDRVLVLSQGQVLEFESPQELLRRPDSVFAGMARDAGVA